MAAQKRNMWTETPLIYSHKISNLIDASVYLKLENLQPSHSFKYRGISHFIQKAKEDHGDRVHLIIASGGNAGLAAASAARVLSVRCTVYLPEGVTQSTLDLLRGEDAEAVVAGRHYAEALYAAKAAARDGLHCVMVPAYDDPLLWEGHSSVVEEIASQLPSRPDAILCSVGGGGLLGGLITGCRNVGWEQVPLIALETIGSNCFHLSISLNKADCVDEVKLPPGVQCIRDETEDLNLAHFEYFTSKASGSLGASQPAAAVVKMALNRDGGVHCVSIPDPLSMETAIHFAEDHKMLVELACSTTLAAAYNKNLIDALVPRGGQRPVVVFIVCGGFKVSWEDFVNYKSVLASGNGEKGYNVLLDGDQLVV